MSEFPWSVPIRVDDVPETGLKLELVADEPTRAAIARAIGVIGLSRLEASFEVTRKGRDGLRVEGRVQANVLQTCVVTLEPVAGEIDEAVDLVFAANPKPAREGPDQALLIDAPEPPEPLVGGVVDLAAVTVEFLNLGIDPYPRKPGAVFEAPVSPDGGATPFAALAALKRGKK